MLFRMYQAAIFIAVAWTNIYFQLIDNPYIVGGLCFLVAYAMTSWPLAAWDRWKYRAEYREEYARRKAMGMTYGWRRHLPWNANKPG